MADAPVAPLIERTSVPASAIFSAEEMTPPPPPVAAEKINLEVTPPGKTAGVASPEATPDAAKVAADKVAADKVTADKVAADKVAADKITADKVAADAAAASAAPVEQKVKIGDKEYTTKELEAAVASAAASKVAPAPVAAAAPTPEPVKPLTPEEIATYESNWQTKFIADEKLTVPVTEKEMESILTGDKDGVALLSGKLNSVVAKAVMLARKSVYAELNPILGQLQANLKPVFQSNAQIEAAAAENEFLTAFPDFKTHIDTVRKVGDALFKNYPNECRAMTRQQILQEVAAQSDRILQDEYIRYVPAGKNWRDVAKVALAAAPVAPVVAAPVAAPVVAAPAAAPAAKVQAPAGNSPAGTPVGGPTKDWNKSTAASLAS
jgi:hypothetical protein